MIVRFLINNIYDGWMPDDNRLGGTEESIVEWADILSKKYTVQVFSNFMSDEPFEYRGATYYPRHMYLEKVGEEPGVTVNVKSYDIDVVEPSVYLTNETDAYRHDLSDFTYGVLPSKWAMDNIPLSTEVRIVPHGYDPSEIYPKEKVSKQCLYASSPDRGLETLTQIWPAVVNAHPDATLLVTYGGDINTPNTTCLGEVSNEKMNDLYNTSDIWIHPCNGGELFGITGIKAQAAGAVPVYFPTMALEETVQTGISCSTPREMYAELINVLGDEELKESYRVEMSLLDLPTWESSTEALESVILDTWTMK